MSVEDRYIEWLPGVHAHFERQTEQCGAHVVGALVSDGRREIREDALQGTWLEAITEEQRARVVRANDEWLGPFTEFTARFGSANEGPISKQNLKSVVPKTLLNA